MTKRAVNRCARVLCGAILTAALAAAPLRAQGTVVSTLGPGDSFETIFGWLVGGHATSPIHQDLAEGFTYTGPGPVRLTRVRLALSEGIDSRDGLLIAFLHGSSLPTASVLESWTLPSTLGSTAALRDFDSVLEPVLMPGETYWVRATHDHTKQARWNWLVGSRTDFKGFWQLNSPPTWFYNEPNASPGYDVATTGVIPEPATLALVAIGLAGVALVRRRV